MLRQTISSFFSVYKAFNLIKIIIVLSFYFHHIAVKYNFTCYKDNFPSKSRDPPGVDLKSGLTANAVMQMVLSISAFVDLIVEQCQWIIGLYGLLYGLFGHFQINGLW